MVNPKRKKIVSTIITILLAVFAIALLVSPNFKAAVISGLMKIGLFQPNVPDAKVAPRTDLGAHYTVQFTNAAGETLNRDSLIGKVVFINFWAVWCPPCIAEMPTINELYTSFKNNPSVVFLLVDADNSLEKSIPFMQSKNYDLPVYRSKGEIPPSWYHGSLPTTVVLDKKSNIVYHHEGVSDYNSKKFKDFISKLAAQ